MPKKTLPTAAAASYQLKIVLLDVRPEVWRSFRAPSSLPLPTLHLALQNIMGWDNDHLHSFQKGLVTYQTPHPDDFDQQESALQDERRAQLSDLVVRPKQNFIYQYDFGDDWQHLITLEAISPLDPAAPLIHCLDGKNACPPEDCGGAHGYADLRRVLKNPKHEDYDHLRQWAGDSFDPALFDREKVNRALLKIKVPSKIPSKKKPTIDPRF